MNRVGSLALAAAVLLATGCATAGHQRRDYVQQQMDGFRYQKALTDVWKDVLMLLAEQDFMLGPNDAKLVGQREMGFAERMLSPAKDTAPMGDSGGLVQILASKKNEELKASALQLETDWRKRDQVRYRVEGSEGPEGTQIRFFKITAQRDNQNPEERDPEMELALLRRVDPEHATPIDDAADKIKQQ